MRDFLLNLRDLVTISAIVALIGAYAIMFAPA